MSSIKFSSLTTINKNISELKRNELEDLILRFHEESDKRSKDISNVISSKVRYVLKFNNSGIPLN